MNRTSAASAVSVVAALVALSARAQEGFGVPEILSPEEEAARELARKKQAAPVLSVSPTSLSLTLDPGGSAARTVTVRNAGGQALAWAARADASWVEVAPAVGRLGFEEEARVTLRASAEGLQAGSHRATVTIDAGGIEGSPARVSVSINVRRPEPPPEREPPEREPVRPSPRGRRRPVEPPVRRPPPTGARDGLGVRVGAVLPASGDAADYGANPVLGVSYRRGVLEAGLDLGAAEEAEGYTSTPLELRLDALFGKGAGYLLAGGVLALEFVDDARDGTSYTNGALALDLGAGYAFAGGRADVRVVYQVLLGSDNVRGQPALMAGWRF